MALIQTTILAFTFFSFFIGQIFRLNIFDISFPLIDIAIGLLAIFNFTQHVKNKDLKLTNKYFFYFLIFSWIFLIINIFKYQIYSIKPLFYLIRLTSLLSLFILPLDIKEKFKKYFLIFVFSNIIFGIMQYLIWPDFTYFDVNNWDPHLYRLVSTYFDPTFTALIYLFLIIKLFLEKDFRYKKIVLFVSYIAMALTYSRSTYLSFLVAFMFIAIKLKKLKIFLYTILIVLLTIILLPRQPGEGTKLERTSSIFAKIENYQEGISLFSRAPLVGYGYNNLSFIRNSSRNSHAISGFDGSLLTVLTTTGIIGFIFFILGINTFYNQSNIVKKTMLISLLVHSLFANSMLYPWILLSFIFF
jgi:hypothetical protein